MIRGLYTAASGMITQQRKHDSVTNNIANMQTPGFKQETAAIRSFPDMLIHLMDGNNPAGKQIGSLTTGVFVEENMPVFLQGDLQETNRPWDLALVSNIQLDDQDIVFDSSGKAVVNGEVIFQPQAFFTVLGADGEQRYTRDGRFSLDAEGQLVTANGELVLGVDGGPVVINGIPFDQVYISENGTLIDRTDGLALGNVEDDVFEPLQLLISRIDNPYDLIREGNGNYRLAEGAQAAVQAGPGDQVAVRQGFIERSNVDAAQSMVDMMTALRLYEANQRLIQSYDQTLDKAVNEIGRV